MRKRQNDLISSDFDPTERDSLSARYEFESIVKVLKTRFSDYSNDAPALATLSPALKLGVLRQVFELSCRATSFDKFCEELNALQASRDAQTQAVDEEQNGELVTAQLFNNFVVQILEKRRKIGAAFLKLHIVEISPKVAQELDFDAYSTEPTVHIFGAQVSRLCDLVFSIPYKDRSKGAQPVVVPLEHKSTQTRDVVFQLLTSLVLVLQYIRRHKKRFQRSDKKFVWPFLLLFYTGSRSWKKVLNFPELFATPDAELDKLWIFKLPFKFVSLFARSKRQIEKNPWLEAFLELTKAAERIVAKKDATEEDWKKAWNDAFETLRGKIDPTDEEEPEIFSDFIFFVSKFSVRKGWEPPTRETFTSKLEELGGVKMKYKIDSIYDLGVIEGEQRGEQRGKQEGKQETLREMLVHCISIRFPQITQATINGILSITDDELLKSIFNVACAANSQDAFQKDVRKLAPTSC